MPGITLEEPFSIARFQATRNDQFSSAICPVEVFETDEGVSDDRFAVTVQGEGVKLYNVITIPLVLFLGCSLYSHCLNYDRLQTRNASGRGLRLQVSCLLHLHFIALKTTTLT